MRPVHLIGVLLWRGGILLASATALIQAARWILRFADPPAQVEIGLGLVIAGIVLVFLSIIIERVQDCRAEKELDT